MATNLPVDTPTDSAYQTKLYFDNFGSQPVEYLAVEYDMAHSFFEQYGFSHDAANTVASTILKQAKLGYKYVILETGDVSVIRGNGNPTPVFEILDTLTIVAANNSLGLSALVGGILNSDRTVSSTLGFKRTTVTTSVTRNIAA